jgi:thioredoxin-related protein
MNINDKMFVEVNRRNEMIELNEKMEKDFDYSTLYKDNKGTKTIRVSRDIYDALQFCKGMNKIESMTKTIARLFNDFQYDCIPVKRDVGNEEWVFMVKSKNGRLRKIPKFAEEHTNIRLRIDLYNKLLDASCNPEESLNMTIFRMLCSHYQNKYIYRIFTGHNCINCDRLHEHVTDLLAENAAIADNVFVEYIADSSLYLNIYKSHGATNMPVSILYNTNGKEVWHSSGYHDPEEVTAILEKAASKS